MENTKTKPLNPQNEEKILKIKKIIRSKYIPQAKQIEYQRRNSL